MMEVIKHKRTDAYKNDVNLLNTMTRNRNNQMLGINKEERSYKVDVSKDNYPGSEAWV